MQQSDEFSFYHDEMLDGHYGCVDRIVLNGYFPLGQQGGGFRTWWRQITGSDDTLDQSHLQRMAGRFSRRVHAWFPCLSRIIRQPREDKNGAARLLREARQLCRVWPTLHIGRRTHPCPRIDGRAKP